MILSEAMGIPSTYSSSLHKIARAKCKKEKQYCCQLKLAADSERAQKQRPAAAAARGANAAMEEPLSQSFLP
jgi:hypothetical protein